MSLQYGAEETPLAGSYGAADSFPKDFGYGVEEEEEEAAAGGGGGAGAGGGCGPGGGDSSKPRILLMGLRRSGKSSIQKVVFHKMSPNETLFWKVPTRFIKMTFPTAPLSTSRFGIFLGRWTSSTQPLTMK